MTPVLSWFISLLCLEQVQVLEDFDIPNNLWVGGKWTRDWYNSQWSATEHSSYNKTYGFFFFLQLWRIYTGPFSGLNVNTNASDVTVKNQSSRWFILLQTPQIHTSSSINCISSKVKTAWGQSKLLDPKQSIYKSMHVGFTVEIYKYMKNCLNKLFINQHWVEEIDGK